MCAKFHRTETEDDTLEMTSCEFKVRVGVFLFMVVFLSMAISIGVIIGMRNANLRTDALRNVTRIASHGSVNTTLDEDLSNCTTSSIEYCTLIDNGTWYIEAENSFYGKLLNYSYFMNNGDIVSCKELRDGDVSDAHGLPCGYYVGLSICIGGLLSAASTVILFTRLVPVLRSLVKEWMLKVLVLSWLLFHGSLNFSSLTVSKVLKDTFLEGVKESIFSVYDRTFPSLLHFYMLALVGWMSVFSQRHFLVVKKSRTVVSPCGHIWDVIVRWAPYCAYFPAFFFINWLLSYVMPLFPYGIMPACDESCWLRQNTLLFSFTAPVAVFALFNMNGGVMLKYHEKYLEDPQQKESFVFFSKLFYCVLIIWVFGVLVNCVEYFYMFRRLFNMIAVYEGFVILFVVHCSRN